MQVEKFLSLFILSFSAGFFTNVEFLLWDFFLEKREFFQYLAVVRNHIGLATLSNLHVVMCSMGTVIRRCYLTFSFKLTVMFHFIFQRVRQSLMLIHGHQGRVTWTQMPVKAHCVELQRKLPMINRYIITIQKLHETYSVREAFTILLNLLCHQWKQTDTQEYLLFCLSAYMSYLNVLACLSRWDTYIFFEILFVTWSKF